ncbi:glutamyl-tRNA reductase [Gorillibacterium massiliense]|uniref:glutamyl-tRNA reductase n=1 Tax=Gorillibacterium massiliense TaxID=1280390 RepID=UPI0004B842B3|nr:glutamyl-tRNA reductase [Gorillibacterium massiliense]
MHILAVGLNYRTAPVEIREQFAIAAEEMPLALRELKMTTSVLECVIISTCNRTEIYLVVDRNQMCGHHIRAYMEKRFGVSREAFNPYLYFMEDGEAIRHLFRVSCGLDSMIIGETQILGQVRDAFLLAQREQATGTLFNRIFKQAITVGKRAQTETAIGENPVSVSYAAVELGKRIFGQFEGKTVLLIGAGKMSELTAKHLNAGGAEKILVVNRTAEKARELAGKMNGVAFSLEQLPQALAMADIVISSTGSQEVVISKEMVAAVLPARRNRPLFMIDIAVPRDIDPGIAELADVFLYDIDDLETMVAGNLEERRKEAAVIEKMIAEEYEAYDLWYRTLGVAPVIQALQTKASRIHEDTLDSMLKKLPSLTEREETIIRRLTKSMLNQMMRDPILRVKEMAGERDGAEALDMFVKLLALEEQLAEKEAELAAAQAAEAEAREALERVERESADTVKRDRFAAALLPNREIAVQP